MIRQFSWLTIGMSASFMLVFSPLASQLASACPFCETIRQTLTEQIDAADGAVIAMRVVDTSGQGGGIGSGRTFRIVKVLSGAENIGQQRKINAIYFGEHSADQKFLILGNKVPELMWASPIALSDDAFSYLNQQLALPRDSHERVALAIEYLTSEEQMLRNDAYDEFARAPYDHLHEIKDRIDPAELLAEIKNEKTPWERRRLFLTLLGVCATAEHVDEVEALLESHAKKRQSALDALAACYMTLRGPAALPLLEEKFLSSEDADQMVRASAVISALRFHGERSVEVPKQEIAKVLERTMSRPQLAGKVLVDLTRWEDWNIVNEVAELYKNATGEAEWVKASAFRYLDACPLEEAKRHVETILAADPDARVRSRPYFPIQSTAAAKDADGEKSAVANESAPAVTPPTPDVAVGPEAIRVVRTEGTQMEAGDSGSNDSPAAVENRTLRIAYLAIFPLAAACLFVLFFWRRKKLAPEAPDGNPDGGDAADSSQT